MTPLQDSDKKPSLSGDGQLSRRSAICRAIERCISETPTGISNLALEFLTQYRARVPMGQRLLNVPESGDVIRDADAVRKQLERWLRGSAVHMPVEAEEAIVYSLPEPYRRDLIAELAARYELLPLTLRELAAGCADEASPQLLMLHCSQAVAALAGSGGKRHALAALDSLIASAVALRTMTQVGVGDGG